MNNYVINRPRPKYFQRKQLEELANVRRDLRNLEFVSDTFSKKDEIIYKALKNKYINLRNEFVMQNIGLVYAKVNQTKAKKKNEDDLYASSVESFINALDKYLEYYYTGNPNSKKPVPTKDISFTTYVLNCIGWDNTVYFVKDSYMFSFPSHIASKIASIHKAETKLMKSGKYTLEDIAKKVKEKPEVVKELKDIPKELLDIDTLYREEKAQLSYEYNPESEEIEKERKLVFEHYANYFLAVLTERERHVIESYFGINDFKKTYEEIGEELGVSRQRIHQIRNTAMRKMIYNI